MFGIVLPLSIIVLFALETVQAKGILSQGWPLTTALASSSPSLLGRPSPVNASSRGDLEALSRALFHLLRLYSARQETHGVLILTLQRKMTQSRADFSEKYQEEKRGALKPQRGVPTLSFFSSFPLSPSLSSSPSPIVAPARSRLSRQVLSPPLPPPPPPIVVPRGRPFWGQRALKRRRCEKPPPRPAPSVMDELLKVLQARGQAPACSPKVPPAGAPTVIPSPPTPVRPPPPSPVAVPLQGPRVPTPPQLPPPLPPVTVASIKAGRMRPLFLVDIASGRQGLRKGRASQSSEGALKTPGKGWDGIVSLLKKGGVRLKKTSLGGTVKKEETLESLEGRLTDAAEEYRKAKQQKAPLPERIRLRRAVEVLEEKIADLKGVDQKCIQDHRGPSPLRLAQQKNLKALETKGEAAFQAGTRSSVAHYTPVTYRTPPSSATPAPPKPRGGSKKRRRPPVNRALFLKQIRENSKMVTLRPLEDRCASERAQEKQQTHAVKVDGFSFNPGVLAKVQAFVESSLENEGSPNEENDLNREWSDDEEDQDLSFSRIEVLRTPPVRVKGQDSFPSPQGISARLCLSPRKRSPQKRSLSVQAKRIHEVMAGKARHPKDFSGSLFEEMRRGKALRSLANKTFGRQRKGGRSKGERLSDLLSQALALRRLSFEDEGDEGRDYDEVL